MIEFNLCGAARVMTAMVELALDGNVKEMIEESKDGIDRLGLKEGEEEDIFWEGGVWEARKARTDKMDIKARFRQVKLVVNHLSLF